MKNFFNYYFYKSLNNTNDEIKKLNKNNSSKSNLAIFSLEQKNGRGRSGNLWKSSNGDLTCSFLVNEIFDIRNIGQINILVVYKLLRMLKELYPGFDFKFKWPNDIFLDNRKLGGILIETVITKKKILQIVFGIGINFISSPETKKYKAVCLTEFSDNSNALNFFLKFSLEFAKSLQNFNKNNFQLISNELTNKMKISKKLVKIKQNKKVLSGKFIGIDKLGFVLLKNNHDIMRISYGEFV